MMQMNLLKIYVMIYVSQVTGLTNGKCLLTRIYPDKIEKLFSQEKHEIRWLFADDTSLFSKVNYANESFENLSNDLCIISNRAYQ